MAWCTTCGTDGFGGVCPRCGSPYPPSAQPQPTPMDVGDTQIAPGSTWGPQAASWPAEQPYPAQQPSPQQQPYPQQPWPPAPRSNRWVAPAAVGTVVVALAVGAALVAPRLLAAAAPTPSTTTIRVTATPAVTPTLAAAPAAATTVPAAPAAPAPAPAVTSTVVRPAGPDRLSATYVMVLESLDKNSVTLTQARAKAEAVASGTGRTPKVLDSSATAGMNPGYWAVVDGPHSTESGARASCAAYGRTQGTGECYLRVLG